jgi:hypothetical protein
MINSKRIFGAGVILWVVSAVFTWLTCGWLFNWVYQITPLIWKGPEAIMSASNLIGSNLIGLVSAFLFVFVYAVLYKGIPGKGATKGMNFGILVWLITAFSGMVGMAFYMTISEIVIVYWVVQALILNLIKGAIMGAIYKNN